MTLKQRFSPATIAATADEYLDQHSGAITPPIMASTTFARDQHNTPYHPEHIYARDNNPTYKQAEQLLAKLEGGKQALLFSSGMAAIAAVFYTLNSGSHVVLPSSMYWGVYSWTRDYCARTQIHISYYQADDNSSLAAVLQAQPKADIVWVETPSNPMMHVCDIQQAAALAHAAGALLVVDNTAPTPVHSQPLSLGADIVMHSATKYLNGHSDVLAGALITKDSSAHWQRIVKERHDAGAVVSPFDAWLLLRGMRTLFVRVQRATENTQKIAEFLDAHPQVERVLYPGISSHPGHDIAKKQMRDGFGALLSFQVVGGRDAALVVIEKLQLIITATSLGGVETLIEHRYSVEPPETKVPENLLRLAVGIEQCDDLIQDLQQALGSLT